MSTVTMAASTRTLTGKGAARKIRKSGLIPAVVYREGKVPALITINPKTLVFHFEKTRNPNTLVTLEVEGGNNATCLVKEVQRHPVSGAIRHVDFYEVLSEESIVVSVPVKTTGRAVGTTLGGAIRIIRRDLDIRCAANNIPQSINVDVTSLDIGKFIKVNEIPNPEGVEILFDDNRIFNVVTVVKRRGVKVVSE